MFLRCLGRELSTYYFVRSKRCCWRTQHERRKRNAGRLIYWNEQRGSQAHAFVVRIMKLAGQRHESRSAQTPFGDLRRLVHTPGTQQRYEGRFMLDDDRFALSGTAEPTFRQKEQLEQCVQTRQRRRYYTRIVQREQLAHLPIDERQSL